MTCAPGKVRRRAAVGFVGLAAGEALYRAMDFAPPLDRAGARTLDEAPNRGLARAPQRMRNAVPPACGAAVRGGRR